MSETKFPTVAVLGAGTMGAGIAQVCAQAGSSVVLQDITDAFVQKGLQRIRDVLQKGVDKGKVTQEQRDAVLTSVTVTTDRCGAAKDREDRRAQHTTNDDEQQAGKRRVSLEQRRVRAEPGPRRQPRSGDEPSAPVLAGAPGEPQGNQAESDRQDQFGHPRRDARTERRAHLALGLHELDSRQRENRGDARADHRGHDAGDTTGAPFGHQRAGGE